MATTISIDQTASTLPQKKGDPPNLGTVKSGRALAFDGVVDYFDLGSSYLMVDFSEESTTANKAWTVACWINYDEVSSDIKAILGDSTGGSGVTRSSSLISLSSTEKLQIYDVAAGAWRGGNTILQPLIWYRAVWVFDGSGTVTFYLNGASDGTGTISIAATGAVFPADSKVADKKIMIGGAAGSSNFGRPVQTVGLHVSDGSTTYSDAQLLAKTATKDLEFNGTVEGLPTYTEAGHAFILASGATLSSTVTSITLFQF